ncbi:hypothetical protein D3C80_1835760 [compost metagenome]
MLHIQIVQRFVQKHIFRVLSNDHRDKCTLFLSATKLIQKFMLHRRQIHISDSFVNILMIFLSQSALRIGKPPKAHKILNGQLDINMIGLLQDGNFLG